MEINDEGGDNCLDLAQQKSTVTRVKDSNLPIAGGMLVGLAGGLCCAGPLVLILLGISGSWIATLTLLEPYQPLFMIVVAGAFGYSGWQFFRPIEQCAPGSACAIPRIRRRRQTVFWISLPVAVTLVSSSYWIPLVA